MMRAKNAILNELRQKRKNLTVEIHQLSRKFLKTPVKPFSPPVATKQLNGVKKRATGRANRGHSVPALA